MGAHDDRNENEWIGSHPAKIDASHGAAELVLSGKTDELWRCGGAFHTSLQWESDEASRIWATQESSCKDRWTNSILGGDFCTLAPPLFVRREQPYICS